MACFHRPACAPVDRCLAFDRFTHAPCSCVRASPDSKWCSIHEGLQAKLLKSYKRWSFALDDARRESTIPTPHDIAQESDLQELRKWSEVVRGRWILTRRVIEARREHHDQYYFGGDDGHTTFVLSLHTECDELEDLLRQLDRRAHLITLAFSKAEWVLDLPKVSICTDQPFAPLAPHDPSDLPPTPPSPTASLPPPPSPSKSRKRKARRHSQVTSEDPTEDCQKGTCVCVELTSTERLESLLEYLSPPATLPTSIRPETWRRFISSLFRSVILRISSLAPLALGVNSDEREYADVETFLRHLGTKEEFDEGIDALWRGMKMNTNGLLDVRTLGEALMNLDREEFSDERGKSVELLGGSVWKDCGERRLSDECWDLFYQFIDCPGCAQTQSRTFTALSRNRRLATLGVYPLWNPAESESEQICQVMGLVSQTSNGGTCGRKLKRVPQKVGKKKVVVVEEWERGWMYCRMPIDSPHTLAFLNLLTSRDDCVVLSRRSDTGEVTHTPPPSALNCKSRSCTCAEGPKIWLSRLRSGSSPAERKGAVWTTTTFFPVDSVLDGFRSNSPEKRYGWEYTDAQEILIIDNRSYEAQSTWLNFADRVAEAARTVLGGGTLAEIRKQECDMAGIFCQSETKARRMFREV